MRRRGHRGCTVVQRRLLIRHSRSRMRTAVGEDTTMIRGLDSLRRPGAQIAPDRTGRSPRARWAPTRGADAVYGWRGRVQTPSRIGPASTIRPP